MSDPSPLEGRRLLVARSRVGRDVLGRRLSDLGAEVVGFPELEAGLPDDRGALSRAAATLRDYDWLIVSGELSVRHLLRCEQLDDALKGGPRLAAIGRGTIKVLREVGLPVQAQPRVHTPAGVAAVLGQIAGQRLLLVHEQSAPDDLARALRARGARVSDVAGYRLRIRADRTLAHRAFGERSDGLALANPSAVRMLARAATIAALDLQRCLGGVPVVAVGPATAAAATAAGLPPDLVSRGRVADLVADLLALLGGSKGAVAQE
jgi:uroporphyrinogen III methyltransferase/synthase